MSGAADAAYYVGECKPCRATISNVVATLSAVGYSGTNATGVVIRDSLWDRNGAGILPNTYANEALAPQSRTTIVRNTVTNSGLARVPIRTPLAGFIGIGIAVAGGNENTISRNRVSRSQRYGIAIFPTARFVVFDPGTPEPGPPWRPRGNRVYAERRHRQRPRRSRARAGLGEGQLLLAQRRGALLAARPPDPHLRSRVSGRRRRRRRRSHPTRPRHVGADDAAPSS